MALDFLARTFGLDKLPTLLRVSLQALRRPVEKGVNWVLDKIIKLAQKAWQGVKQGGAAVCNKATQPGPDTRTLAQKQAALDQAMAAAQPVVRDPHRSPAEVVRTLIQLRRQHQLTALDIRDKGTSRRQEHLQLHGAVNPEKDIDLDRPVEGPGELEVAPQREENKPEVRQVGEVDLQSMGKDTIDWFEKYNDRLDNTKAPEKPSKELMYVAWQKVVASFDAAKSLKMVPTGAVGAMQFSNDRILVGTSRGPLVDGKPITEEQKLSGKYKGFRPDDLHPRIKNALNQIWMDYLKEGEAYDRLTDAEKEESGNIKPEPGKAHGWCAEPWIISQALWMGIEVSNATAIAVFMRYSPKKSLPICSCNSCVRLLQMFNIKDGVFDPDQYPGRYPKQPQ